jgi:hypothetical protein
MLRFRRPGSCGTYAVPEVRRKRVIDPSGRRSSSHYPTQAPTGVRAERYLSTATVQRRVRFEGNIGKVLI